MKINLDKADDFIDYLKDNFEDKNLTVKDVFFMGNEGRTFVKALSPYLSDVMNYELSRNKNVYPEDFNRPLADFLASNSNTHLINPNVGNPELLGLTLLYDLMNTPLDEISNKRKLISFNLESKEMAKGENGLLDLCQNSAYYNDMLEENQGLFDFGKGKRIGNIQLESSEKYRDDRMENRDDYYVKSELSGLAEDASIIGFAMATITGTSMGLFKIAEKTEMFTKIIPRLEVQDIFLAALTSIGIFAVGVIHDYANKVKEDQKIVKRDLKTLRSIDLAKTEALENAVVNNKSILSKEIPEKLEHKALLKQNYKGYARSIKEDADREALFILVNPLSYERTNENTILKS